MDILLTTILTLTILYTAYYNWTELRVTSYLHNVYKIKSTKFKLSGHDIYYDGIKIMRYDGTLYRWIIKYSSSKRLKICDELKKTIKGE